VKIERLPRVYGLLAEFDTPQKLVVAARRSREAGYRRVEAYTPFPIEELNEALALRPSRLPWIVLGGAVVGGLAGFLLQYWFNVIEYPMNIGGRPHNSWPAFLVPTFETTVLASALAAVLGMFALNGLPMPHHPVFNVERFALASRNRYFLCIEARDRRFDRGETQRFLESLQASEVSEIDY
jgi:hypothetical protein